MLTIDFESIQRLVTASIASSLKSSQRPVLETAEKRTGVVDAHRLYFPRQIMLPLLDERLGHRRDFINAAVQPHSCIDIVREQVARNTAPGNAGIQTPQAFPALRQVARRVRVLDDDHGVRAGSGDQAKADSALSAASATCRSP